jgi:hypothetical protein
LWFGRECDFNPDFPLDPSSSRRRGSSKKNTPRSGQNLDFDLLCREFLINWIPACAGMTKFRANGKSRFKAVTYAKYLKVAKGFKMAYIETIQI